MIRIFRSRTPPIIIVVLCGPLILEPSGRSGTLENLAHLCMVVRSGPADRLVPVASRCCADPADSHGKERFQDFIGQGFGPSCIEREGLSDFRYALVGVFYYETRFTGHIDRNPRTVLSTRAQPSSF